jgi:hypothetical protein
MKNVEKIENFNNQKVVTLNQRVADRRYLILDLWEDIGSDVSADVPADVPADFPTDVPVDRRYRQLFLQINNLKVINVTNDRVYFDLTHRPELINKMTLIEDHILQILKNYLEKINKKGKFNFCSVVKDDRNPKGDGNIALALNIGNADYPVNIFDNNRTISTVNLLSKKGATFNIIIELLQIDFDMREGLIVIDTKLRLVVENVIKIQPTRIKLTDVDNFIYDENKNVNKINEICQESDVNNIRQSFDITQTEVFEDDIPKKQFRFNPPVKPHNQKPTESHNQKPTEPHDQKSDQKSDKTSDLNKICVDLVAEANKKEPCNRADVFGDDELSESSDDHDGQLDQDHPDDRDHPDDQDSDSGSDIMENLEKIHHQMNKTNETNNQNQKTNGSDKDDDSVIELSAGESVDDDQDDANDILNDILNKNKKNDGHKK